MNFGVRGNGGIISPAVNIMSSDIIAIIRKRKVDFEDSVAELIIKEKGFIRIRVRFPHNAAHSVRNIGVIGPRVIKIIRWLGARNITYSGCDIPIFDVI